MRTISEVARFLGVDRELVKTWVGMFPEQLSEWAQPEAGRTRLFTDADTRALALVSDLWEDDPDLENIHACLNTGEQNSDRYVELVHLDTPVFQDVPNDLDESWDHGVLLSTCGCDRGSRWHGLISTPPMNSSKRRCPARSHTSLTTPSSSRTATCLSYT